MKTEIIAPPLHRAWSYNDNEHKTIRLASGISYDVYHFGRLPRMLKERYSDLLGDECCREKPCRNHDSKAECQVYERTRTACVGFPSHECCPLPFFRNMTKRDRTIENIRKLYIRFATRRYCTMQNEASYDEDSNHEYDTDVDVVHIKNGNFIRNVGDTNTVHPSDHDEMEIYTPYDGMEIFSFNDFEDIRAESGGTTYVPLSTELLQDIRNLNFGHDGTLDFESRHRGLTPFAVMDPTILVPPSFLRLVIILVQYQTLLDILFEQYDRNDGIRFPTKMDHLKELGELIKLIVSKYGTDANIGIELQIQILWAVHHSARLQFYHNDETAHLRNSIRTNEFPLARMIHWLNMNAEMMRRFEPNYDMRCIRYTETTNCPLHSFLPITPPNNH